jgi:two-component system, NtrC family, sensor kinase
MRRRTKPAKVTVEREPPAAGKAPKAAGARVRDLEKRLAESLEREKATSDILRVISRSQAEVQPVFDTIVQSAARLCHAGNAGVFLTDGRMVHHPANYGSGSAPEALAVARARYPRPLDMDTMPGIAILTRSVVHVPDIEEPSAVEVLRQTGRLLGFRSTVAVPMLREGEAIGSINVARREPGRFSDAEVELLQTFADQAVIAIQNVRLFNELEARNRDLTQTLEQQTAMAEILEVISTSPTHLQPVLDAVVKSAARFCAAPDASIFRLDGEHLRADAHHGSVFQPSGFLVPVVRGTVAGRSVLERQAVSVTDLQAETEEFPEGSSLARETGQRATLSAPLLREGAPIGVILLRRAEAVPFTGKQIALVKTFADQAVIAIENVRLFKELEVRNRDLTESLEQQTAASEILRVISSSPTDIQPVFDAIAHSAARLCEAFDVVVLRVQENVLHLVAHHGPLPVVADVPLHRRTLGGRTMIERRVIHILDLQAEVDEFPEGSAIAQAGGHRTTLSVPLLKEGVAIGNIQARRQEVRPFSDTQISLLTTFADQAVIAIENVRLFKELQARTAELTRSVGELTALGEVSQAISSTLDLQTVLHTIVARATQLADADAGVIYEYDEQREIFEPRATERLEDHIVQALVATPVQKGQGATGRLAEVREPIQLGDVRAVGEQIPVRDVLIRAGYRALLAVPLVREDHLIGGLTVFRKTPGEFPADTVELLKTFATQSALAIQNARLFREIADKSRQLEAASQHKSEFLANMSHELRTPLNAIIGFSEVLAERMFGEINEKQSEYLQDILESGRHLLSLINDILDLSKIEAGRMELEAADFDLPSAIENALLLVRERASRRGITLGSTIDERLGTICGDERKVKQVLLNLLSNALKFTPEGGEIDVTARLHDHLAEVSVADTGIGIAPTDQDTVFEEFRQVGTADKKAEGTGLGLTLSRKFIELHGGRIWVTSQVGVGSTFTFTLPMHGDR